MKRNTLTKILIVLLMTAMFPACDDEGKKGAVGPVTKIVASVVQGGDLLTSVKFTWHSVSSSGVDQGAVSDELTISFAEGAEATTFELDPYIEDGGYFAIYCDTNSNVYMNNTFTL